MSAERSYRDTLRWALAEVVDDVVIAARWSRVVPLVEAHLPGVVVLDFDSIERPAREVLLAVLKIRCHVSVVAIGTPPAVVDAETLGVRTTVPKPLNVGLLMAHVERIVAARRGH